MQTKTMPRDFFGKRTLLVAGGLLGVAAGLLGASPVRAQTFGVDFSSHTGPDLVKNKFGVYQTPFWFLSNSPNSHNMTPLLQEAGVHDLRYEMGWGKPDTYAYDQINGSASSPTIDFSRLDPFVQQMAAAGTTPLFAMTYDPLPLKTGTDWQRWKDVPDDLNVWQWINQQYAAHYSNALGVKGVHYEMWNEPDLPGDGGKVFFNGGPGDYGNVFRYGVAGVRAGAADATVGGPAIAYDTGYLTGSGLLSDAPDFVSLHAYANYGSQIGSVEAALGGANVPLYLTEYASYTSFSPTGPNSTHAAAAAFFEDVKGLLTYPNVQKVYWAQWIDDTTGMLTNSLHRKALFNAYKIYQTLLPVSRSAVSPDGTGGVDLMAGSDSGGAGVVAWNNNTSASNVTINLNNLAGSGGAVQLYRIDGQNASYVDNNASENLSVNGQWTYGGSSTSWSGTIPAQSVVFLRATPSGTFPAPNTYYRLVNQNSGKVAGVTGASTAAGAQLVQWDDNGNPDHNWKFVSIGNGYYHIVDQNSGLLMAVSGASTADSANVTQWTDNGTTDHNWSLVSIGNGYYHIINQNSQKLLAVSGMSTADGAFIQQYHDNGTADHNWRLVAVP